jgi:SAM-dependent methyltransferase
VPAPERPACRFCGAVLSHVFVDLGMSPLSNTYLTEAELGEVEPSYPLRVYLCDECLLVQLEEYETPERIFGDYAYFSSYSSTWLEHARDYASKTITRFDLGSGSRVVEVASNDGYLLQYFSERGIPVLGIEPAANVAAAAEEKGVPTVVDFFGTALADKLSPDSQADLLVGNNVLAHVPDLNDFVAGLRMLLKPEGIVTMEFPHVVRLVEGVQFDTIYHEHFSYFSFLTVQRVFEEHGLAIFDVEELPTHGGSLRIYARHVDDDSKETGPNVEALAERERDAGYDEPERYLAFAEQVNEARREIRAFFVDARAAGNSVAGYGAPAKGNTLLNFCGIEPELMEYTVDLNPHKQHRFLPGTHIPIRAPDAIRETQPDFVFILPWNIKAEIMEQMAFVKDWGGRFVTPIPKLTIHP